MITEPAPGSYGDLLAQKRAKEEMQRACGCGGHEQCEHEQREDVASALEAKGMRETQEVVNVRKREKAVEQKEAWWKKEDERKRKIRMQREEARELAREGRLEGHPTFDPNVAWRSRGRGRVVIESQLWQDPSPERYEIV